MSKSKEYGILSDSEKVEFLEHLEKVGKKSPDNWKLVHSEFCSEDEDNIQDLDTLITKLSSEGFQFKDIDAKFINIVSNPDEDSFLDRGAVKVRYRYVLGAEHKLERKIKENTRDFCRALISRDLLYRREDINIMSFRRANPLSNQNYSIFRLRGHWNCRHTWQREVYIVQDDANINNEQIITSQTVAMSKEQKSLKTKFGEFLTNWGNKLTDEEVVELTSQALTHDFEAHKFADLEVDGKILRVNGDAIAEGASVVWVDEKGEEMPVEDGEYPVEIDGQAMIVVVADGAIASIAEIAEEEAAPEAEQAMSAEEEVVEEVAEEVAEESTEEDAALEAKIEAILEKILESRFSSHSESSIKTIQTVIEAKLKELPAFQADNVETKLSSKPSKSNNSKGTLLERITNQNK